jgi:ribosomal protein S18 acetylase RimI-like enzyme
MPRETSAPASTGESGAAGYIIRNLDPASQQELEWVANGMRQTLIEVEGEATGSALYTMDWLRDRVRWHLDPALCTAAVFLAVDDAARILGHCIVRVECEPEGQRHGLFSTTYVKPESRRRSVAQGLLQHGENWMREQQLAEAATWTSETNARLIGLYRKHGYAVTAQHVHEVTGTRMIRLSKTLTAA